MLLLVSQPSPNLLDDLVFFVLCEDVYARLLTYVYTPPELKNIRCCRNLAALQPSTWACTSLHPLASLCTCEPYTYVYLVDLFPGRAARGLVLCPLVLGCFPPAPILSQISRD
jgi:hypothetical protein